MATLRVVLSRVWRYGLARSGVRIAVGAFAGQFVLNLAWTPAFFGLQRPDLGLRSSSSSGSPSRARSWPSRAERLAAALLVPSLTRVSFVAVLNYAIYAGG